MLQRSAMPPHLAIACPSHAAILLAVEPDLTGRLAGEDELQPESRPSAADEPSPAEGRCTFLSFFKTMIHVHNQYFRGCHCATEGLAMPLQRPMWILMLMQKLMPMLMPT